MEPDFTVQTFAKLVGFHPETVRRLIRTGKLPAYRIDSRYRIRREDAERIRASGWRAFSEGAADE